MVEITITDAVNRLISEFKKDPDFKYAYQANIAMAFKDRCYQYKLEHGKSKLSQEDIHIIANEAAVNFLNLLCDEPK